MKPITLNYAVPIKVTEIFGENDSNEFIIQGVAITSSMTDNGHLFVPDELRTSATSLVNRPLLKDHNDSVDSIVGRVVKAEFDEVGQHIAFQAKLNETPQGLGVRELIKSGDLNTVSIGATVKSFEEAEEGIIPRGIKFKELSLVATPADDNAQFIFRGNTFDLALKAAWSEVKNKKTEYLDLSHSSKKDEILVDEIIKLEDNMEKDKTTEKLKTVSESDEEEKEEEKTEESTKVLELKEEIDAVKAKLNATKDLLAEVLGEIKSLKESDEDEKPEEPVEEVTEEVSEEEPKEKEEPAEEPVEESVSEDEEEEDAVEENSSYKVVQGHRFFSVVKNKYR